MHQQHIVEESGVLRIKTVAYTLAVSHASENDHIEHNEPN